MKTTITRGWQITRGMRDIPTIQGNSSRSVPPTREQVVTELAHLEHEKARLERELRIWSSNQQKTVDRLQRLEGRLAILQQQALNPPSAEGLTERSEATRSPAQSTEGSKGETRRWREVKLDY